MKILEIFSNPILNSSLLAWFLAQFLKGFFVLINNGTLSLERFLGAGGMPSSHSAIVSSLTVAVLLKDGFYSTTFPIAFVFAFIVLYDAAGVRYAVGQQAKILNEINRNSEEEKLFDKELKEFLGHTKFEVVVGSLLGILVSYFYWYVFERQV